MKTKAIIEENNNLKYFHYRKYKIKHYYRFNNWFSIAEFIYSH